MEMAAPSSMAPSLMVLSMPSPETVMAVPAPLMFRLPAQTCTPMVLALMTLLSMVSVPELGK